MMLPALQPHRHPNQFGIGLALLILVVPLLLLPPPPAADPALLYWRTAAHLVTVVVAMLIFVTGYRAILSPRKGAVVWLGIAFLGVGLLGFLHLASHTDLLAAPPPEAAQATLWFSLAARLLAALALLVYAALPAVADVSALRKRLAVAIMVVLAGLSGYLALRHPALLPNLLGPAGEANVLYLTLHGATVALPLLCLLVLWRRRYALANECLMALMFAAALATATGAFFTVAGAVRSDELDALAHAYQIATYLFLLHATINEALHRPLERLEMLHRREGATLSAAPDGIIWVDRDGTIELANPAMQTLSGYPVTELVGQNVSIFLPPQLRAKHAESMRNFFQAPHGRAMGEMDLQLCRREGGLQPVDISLGYWEIDGRPHAIAYIRDLTERKRLEDALRHQATHDELTALPSRLLYQLQLRQALLRAERAGHRVAVLFLDLDHFKSVNDTFGHACGDALLVQASQRIKNLLRASDILARMGGDEFAVLLPEIGDADEAVSVALKILACLQEPFVLPNQQVYSGGSVGVAYYPDDAQDGDSLLRCADLAMYQAKRKGRGGYACHSAELDRRTHDDMQLHTRLKAALSQQLLTLHFQPQIDGDSGRLVGAEALLRWHDPVLGLVEPERFIPIAEATGLIQALGDWVMETACRQIAAWQRAGTPTRVAIRLFSQQLHQGQLAGRVREVLHQTGAQAQWLELQITEAMVMKQPRPVLDQLNAVVDMGCSVALDDFGTGHSSLAYLQALPVGRIRIAHRFVQGITDEPGHDVIVQTIIGMARHLGLGVVATGVATPAQRERLALHGCTTCQGQLFHPALAPETFEQLLLQPARAGVETASA